MTEVGYFLKTSYTKDELGQRIPAEKIRREFLCREQSISRNEFDVAGKLGIRASIVLITNSVNYEGEEEVEYDGSVYTVYRVYKPSDRDEIELYLEKRTANE